MATAGDSTFDFVTGAGAVVMRDDDDVESSVVVVVAEVVVASPMIGVEEAVGEVATATADAVSADSRAGGAAFSPVVGATATEEAEAGVAVADCTTTAACAAAAAAWAAA